MQVVDISLGFFSLRLGTHGLNEELVDIRKMKEIKTECSLCGDK